MSEPGSPPRRSRVLRADCGSCVGLCCVALAFSRSADFAEDKAAGEPCRHLADDSACSIHSQLRARGYPGCTVFDCFGAGQRVTARADGAGSWRTEPVAAREAGFALFGRTRQLHELLWHLDEALGRGLEAGLAAEVRAAYDEVDALAGAPAEHLLTADLDAPWRRVAVLLTRVSRWVRREGPAGRPRRGIGPRADLVGAELAGADLRGADLRGSLLIGADLRGADLRLSDLLGVDLRGADLRGADLSTALFLTQVQVAAAAGDTRTRLPAALERPLHWG